MSITAISINELNKSFANQAVLTGVNLDIYEGESLGLIGMNGAGKTTLMKCMLDFTRADSGSIDIYSTPSTSYQAREKLAYLPEKFIAPYYLTGRKFLEYMLKLHGIQYDHSKVTNMVEILDLETSALEKEARKYSKGMSQKLGLCACLLSEKSLVIMDEPMSGLDPKARAYLKQHLMHLKTSGQTLLFSTHMLMDIEKLCDRVAILHEGQIKFLGTPGECCEFFNTTDFEQAYLNCVAK